VCVSLSVVLVVLCPARALPCMWRSALSFSQVQVRELSVETNGTTTTLTPSAVPGPNALAARVPAGAAVELQ
jgi:hypothetical protein